MALAGLPLYHLGASGEPHAPFDDLLEVGLEVDADPPASDPEEDVLEGSVLWVASAEGVSAFPGEPEPLPVGGLCLHDP